MNILPHYRNMLAYIDLKANDFSFTHSQRRVVAAALYDVANDHGKGICTLFENHHDVSAFAMMRIQFETFIRGAWLLHCAKESELNCFIKKDKIELESKEKFYFGDMVEAVELAKDWSGTLSEIKKVSWKALNSYTHGGQHQVARRFDGRTIEPHHEPEQQQETIRFSAMLSFLGFCEMIELSENNENDRYSKELYDQIHSWVF
jgi:hypothetical protein